MKKVQAFLSTNKNAIIWTVLYIAAVYIVLFVLFRFNLFSARHWSILFNARLTGFAGYVFGILLFATIPMYIATVSIVWRTKKLLFDIPMLSKKEEKKSESVEDEKKIEIDDRPLPDTIPAELRGAFIRARHTTGPRNVSAFAMQDVQTRPEPEIAPAPMPEPAGLPLPDDFDLDPTDGSASAAPVFTEITFGSPEPAPMDDDSPLIQYLKDLNYPFQKHDDIVATNELAIITHDDSAFWIADTENWFAAGQQKPSPVAQVKDFAAQHELQPVIYLAQTNIMDLDARIQEWEQMGVRVIVDLQDL